MTEWVLTAASLERLRRCRGLENAENDVLTDMLEDAANELRLYLHRDELPDAMGGYIIRLAAANYRCMTTEHSGAKAWSYSEGEQTQSETPLSGADYEAEKMAILAALASYRQVKVKEAGGDGAAEHAP